MRQVGYGLIFPLLFLSLVLGGMPHAFARTQAIHQVILDLKRDMIIKGEHGASVEGFNREEAEAVETLHRLISSNPTSSALTERDQQGMTPLMAASFEGYSEIVDELLKNKQVAASINDVDTKGLSAWVYANFALKQSLWICNPSILQNAYMMTPLRAVHGYYTGNNPSPYLRIRKSLAAAGAKTDMTAARGAWVSLCRLSDQTTSHKISEAPDLLMALIAESDKTYARLTSR